MIRGTDVLAQIVICTICLMIVAIYATIIIGVIAR